MILFARPPGPSSLTAEPKAPVTVSDLALIKQKTLTAIVRDEQRGEAASRKENNRKQKNRLRCYIYDNRIPDPPVVPQASRLPLSRLPSSVLQARVP